MATLIVEVLRADGAREHLLPFNKSVVKLGRALDNDVVIDDVHADAHHATLALTDAGFILKDNGSLNGVFHEQKQIHPTNGVLLQSGHSFKIGLTTLRVLSPKHNFADPVPLSYPGWFGRLMGNGLVAVMLYLLGVSIIGGGAFIEAGWDEDARQNVLRQVILTALVLPIWAFFWSLIGRIAVYHWRFWTHLAAIMLFVVVTEVMDIAMIIAGYNLHLAEGWLMWPVTGGMLFVLFYQHALAALPLKTLPRSVMACVVSGFFMTVIIAVHFTGQSSFSNTPAHNGYLLPEQARLAPAVSTSTFLQNAAAALAE